MHKTNESLFKQYIFNVLQARAKTYTFYYDSTLH